MTDECQAASRADGVVVTKCPYGPVVSTVTVVCKHEHFTEVRLCQKHIDEVETKARCPHCADKRLGEHRHCECRLRIVDLVSS